jgi:hypothetical protein
MKHGPALQNLTRAIADLCRAVPFDAAFWSTVDPATLLFTQPRQQEIPASTVPYFVHNEFIDDDVNKWTTLARDRVGVRCRTASAMSEAADRSRHHRRLQGRSAPPCARAPLRPER